MPPSGVIRILSLHSVLLSACAARTPMLRPSSGTWTADTVLLRSVVACQGGNSDFSEHHKECNKWPLSIPSLPHPETHHAELRAKAAEQYHIDGATIVLKDVQETYNTELAGTSFADGRLPPSREGALPSEIAMGSPGAVDGPDRILLAPTGKEGDAA